MNAIEREGRRARATEKKMPRKTFDAELWRKNGRLVKYTVDLPTYYRRKKGERQLCLTTDSPASKSAGEKCTHSFLVFFRRLGMSRKKVMLSRLIRELFCSLFSFESGFWLQALIFCPFLDLTAWFAAFFAWKYVFFFFGIVLTSKIYSDNKIVWAT